MTDRSWLPDMGFGSPRQSWVESFVKSLLYRLFMVLITVVVAYVFTTDTTASLQIGIVTNVLKTGTYYAYERLWSRFRVGGLIHGQS